MREQLDLALGGADEANQERVAPGLARLARSLDRQHAGAADDRERGAHAGSSRRSRGVVTARSPPARRKETTVCTAALSGKAAATSSVRAFSVPSSAKSCFTARRTFWTSSTAKPRRFMPTT